MNKLIVTLEDIINRFPTNIGDNHLIYGIPKGGWNIAYLMAEKGYGEVTYDLEKATLVVDDIVDSGITKDRVMKKANAIFFAPYNKFDEPELGWIVFPWDTDEEASIEDAIVRQLQYLGVEVNKDNIKNYYNKMKEFRA